MCNVCISKIKEQVKAFTRLLMSEAGIFYIINRLRNELSPIYSYHSVKQTIDVIHEAIMFSIYDNIEERELELRRMGSRLS